MDIGSGLVALTAIGCGTAIVLTFIDKVFGGRQKQTQQQLRAAEERARQIEQQLADERRHNEQLQKQVEWHGKLLETQDRMLNRLSGPSGHEERALPEQPAVR
jgi:hypothetical protein